LIEIEDRFYPGGCILFRYQGKYLRSPTGLALLLLFLTLILFWGGWWYVFQVLKYSKERDLGYRLEGIGQTAAAVFFHGNNFLLLERPATAELYKDDPLDEYATIKNALTELQKKNTLQNIMIIDTDSRVFVDSENDFYLGEEYPLLKLDAQEIKSAFSGKPATTPLYRIGINPYKRCYVPLYNSKNEVTAVLRLEASRDYFQNLVRIKRHIAWLGLIVICLLFLVALLFYKLLESLLKTEETLALTDRVQSLGTMAAGLAHEIRNPLSIIRATAESLVEESRSDPDHQSLLRSIVDETDRLNQLLTQFLQFARPVPDDKSSSSCNTQEVIHSVLSLLDKEFTKKSIRFEVNPEHDLTGVAMDEKSLRQVLLNILLNAGESIGEKGNVTVSARKKRRMVIVEISDTGRGIPDKDLPRVFDPFFTTKDKGTGLGLFVSRMLVERAGGSISFAKTGANGTSVQIELPAQK
jgi:signal transduction histidine kinase